MFLRSLREEEPPDAHCGILDVTGLQHAVEVLLDGFKVQGSCGFVRLIQHHKTKHILFDAVPHGGIVGVSAFEESSHGQQAAGMAGQVVQAHASETQRIHLDRDGFASVLVHSELHMHWEVAQA